MKRRLSSQESEQRWKTLLTVPNSQAKPTNPNPNPTNHDHDHDHRQEQKETDPFDCSDVAVPPTHDLVERALETHLQRWRELDDRKIVQDATLVEEDVVNNTNKNNQQVTFADQANDPNVQQQQPQPQQKVHKGGWRFSEDRLRLPPNFDYATERTEPPEDDGSGERVLDLLDPSRQLSYHQELWKLFESVPSAAQLTTQMRSGAKLQHTMAIYNEIVEGNKQSSRLDGHSLSRMRMADRHGLPSPAPKSNNDKDNTSSNTPDTPTIRFECWTRQIKRGTSSDCDRLVLEFLASQSLLDLHNTLVQMAEDDLWKDDDKGEEASGCFFLENELYNIGEVDYAGPIIKWIDGGGSPNPSRRAYLGMTSMAPFEAKSMKDTKLGDIPFRLGIRYYHVFHGDVETAIMVVDRRLARHANISYPVVHDIWTPPYPMPICDACKQYPALYATPMSCELTNGGPRALCESCCTHLKLPPDSVQLYSVWRTQADLSTGVCRDHTRYF